MVSQMADGGVIEVAAVGREGVIGLAAILGTRRLAQSVLIQMPGDGLRLPVERPTPFRRAADRAAS